MSRRYEFVAARAGHRCEYCRAPEAVFNFRFEVEHVTPVSKAGLIDDSNLALACRGCNLFKSDTQLAVDPETKELTGFFHPRNQVWSEHFSFDSQSLVIMGITASGRASVAQLQMNHAMQLASRRWWMELGLFP